MENIEEKEKKKIIKKRRRVVEHTSCFNKCKNPALSADIACSYARRRLELGDNNAKGMYADWESVGNGKDFQEAVAAMEFFMMVENYPDMFFPTQENQETKQIENL